MSKKNTVLFLYYLLVIPIISGFLFHKSKSPDFLIFSYPYLTGLILLILVLAFFVPFVLSKFIKKHGVKTLFFSLFPSTVVLILAYAFLNFWYLKQEHPFDPYLQFPKPKTNLDNFNNDDLVILTLGGSTTLNTKLSLENKYPYILEKEIQKLTSSRKVRVVNAGMDWYTSKHSLINYITDYRRIKPDIVIVMHAINDIYRSFSPPNFAIGEYNFDYSHFYGPSIKGAVPRNFEHSYLAWIKGSWCSALKEKKDFDFELKQYKSLEAYKYYLKTLVKCVKQDSSTCLILEQRSLYKDNMSTEEENVLWIGKSFCINKVGKYASNTSLLSAMNAYNNAARDIATQENIGYIKVGDNIESNLLFFSDDVHYTKRGAKTLALTVVDFIKENIDLSETN